MTIKITAEFPTIDDAEYAARSIKQSIDHVDKINIHQKSDRTYSNYYSINPPVSSSYTQNYTSVYFPEYSRITNTSEIESGRESIIEIICDENSKRAVSQKITALGGLKINGI